MSDPGYGISFCLMSECKRVSNSGQDYLLVGWSVKYCFTIIFKITEICSNKQRSDQEKYKVPGNLPNILSVQNMEKQCVWVAGEKLGNKQVREDRKCANIIRNESISLDVDLGWVKESWKMGKMANW